MSETDNKQGQESQTSKLAIASLLVVIFGFCISLAINDFGSRHHILLLRNLSLCVFLLSMLIGSVLGVVAIVKISKSNGKLRGTKFAVWGLVIAVILIIFRILGVIRGEEDKLL